jgi:hypothetical protein
LRVSRNKENLYDNPSARRTERRTTRVPTIVSQVLSPFSVTMKKKESVLKEKLMTNLKQEVIINLKYKEPKET